MNVLLVMAVLLSLVIIAGCVSTDYQAGGETESPSESTIDSGFDDFESTLIGEGDDVEIGSLI